MLNTVKKIGPVLELFTQERPEWRMTDIARALDMPKSSAHSLVATLAEIGLLSVSSQGRYRLGWNLLSLAERMRASLDFSKHAVPLMQELSAAVKETVLLAALDRHEVVYLERVEGMHPLVRLAGVRVGSRAPAYCTSVGKMLLAHRDAAEAREVLRNMTLRPMTRNTLTTVEALEAEFERIRAQGVAFDMQEIVTDVICVAAPVTDDYGAVVAAISVSLPAYRFEQKRESVVAPLKATAAAVSANLMAAQAVRVPAATPVPTAV